jgi:hypothetical protein
LLAFVLVALIARPWNAGTGVFAIGGDDLWLQASAQVAASVGPFGIDPNLGWPSGYALWSVPQLGILLGGILWLFGGVLGTSSAAAVLWAIAVVAGLTAMASLFLFRSVIPTVSITFALPLAVALGGSPAPLVVVGHVNVAAWFLLPLLVGISFRMRGCARRERLLWGLAAFALVAVSPLWWVIVFLLFLGLIILVGLIVRDWDAVFDRLILAAALALGLMVQILLFRSYPNLSGSVSRGRWDSNLFGGNLTDFLLASPLANEYLLPFDDLVLGASREFRPIGVVAAVLGLVLVIMVLLGAAVNRFFPDEPGNTIATLTQWSVVVLLFFLTGGFGNLQAAMAVLLGGGSPARTWSRLGLIGALLGATWLLLALTRWSDRRASSSPGTRSVAVAGVVAAVVVVGIYFVDARQISNVAGVSRVAAQADFAEYGAVEFLRSTQSEPCVTLQLPVTDGLLPRTPQEAEDFPQYYYRGYIPYLMAPQLGWTYGAVSPVAIAELEAIAEPSLTRTDPSLEPFCAVLFDKQAAAVLREEGEPLPGSDVSALGQPDFSGDRFEVFVLPETRSDQVAGR